MKKLMKLEKKFHWSLNQNEFDEGYLSEFRRILKLINKAYNRDFSICVNGFCYHLAENGIVIFESKKYDMLDYLDGLYYGIVNK